MDTNVFLLTAGSEDALIYRVEKVRTVMKVDLGGDLVEQGMKICNTHVA